jgi:hypothetical protein
LILTIVMAFTAGQNLSVFCRAWCDAHDTTNSGCHHVSDTGTVSIGGAASCQHDGVGPVALSRDDARRDSAAHSPIDVLGVARFQVSPLPSLRVTAYGATTRSVEHVPLLSLQLRV